MAVIRNFFLVLLCLGGSPLDSFNENFGAERFSYGKLVLKSNGTDVENQIVPEIVGRRGRNGSTTGSSGSGQRIAPHEAGDDTRSSCQRHPKTWKKIASTVGTLLGIGAGLGIYSWVKA